MKRLLLPALGAVALVGFAACSPDSTDFKSEGEKFIEDDEEAVAKETGFTFNDAECDKPANTDEGTQYDCTATDAEGDEWLFTVEVTGKREMTVVGSYQAKVLQSGIVPQLQTLGTVDEACVETTLEALSLDEIKAATDDLIANETPNAETEAILTNLADTCITAG